MHHPLHSWLPALALALLLLLLLLLFEPLHFPHTKGSDPLFGRAWKHKRRETCHTYLTRGGGYMCVCVRACAGCGRTGRNTGQAGGLVA
ncbi:hypothetical protein BS50DRAFT_576596 [Corynespora cassiicola Philippines]|uniref:Secreted peptide n=1 Tax=Corynespora cassiicola Philippines TaxID=1448308 RepID=A0A2T2NEV1_CORCC|nr:hypothetical protein BS50DRAFT_576596 [Corynespora cassiicola Philippines]